VLILPHDRSRFIHIRALSISDGIRFREYPIGYTIVVQHGQYEVGGQIRERMYTIKASNFISELPYVAYTLAERTRALRVKARMIWEKRWSEWRQFHSRSVIVESTVNAVHPESETEVRRICHI